jgi:hypothetical protein
MDIRWSEGLGVLEVNVRFLYFMGVIGAFKTF